MGWVNFWMHGFGGKQVGLAGKPVGTPPPELKAFALGANTPRPWVMTSTKTAPIRPNRTNSNSRDLDRSRGKRM
ncbi:MAG TPA: hypothetical protein VNM37_13825, partial [Candidatus Dormibacteraeota bacterium]|nr:hypothetical protein [Candidatus Dormibacteraeota bacterium]